MPEPKVEESKEIEDFDARKRAFAEVLVELIEPHAPAINEKFKALGKWLEGVSSRAAPFIQALANVDWEKLTKKLYELPQQSKEAMQIASRQGWFFNWQGSLKQTVQLVDRLHGTEGVEAVDQVLMEHYNDCWDGYVELLAVAFPARKVVIEAAVRAHREFAPAGYSLSIPVFLAQADGIFSEITNTQSAMSKQGGNTKGGAWVKEEIGSDQDAIDLLFPILQLHELDILKSQPARDAASAESGKVFDALNRHQVMHGETSSYGTELNSVKAFSFLVFVALHVPDILQSARERSESETASNPPKIPET